MTSVHSELSQYIENIEKYRKRFDRRSIEFRKVPNKKIFPYQNPKFGLRKFLTNLDLEKFWQIFGKFFFQFFNPTGRTGVNIA